jgi:2-polyprenyl-6-methoxyphenol hydroxylase-like FAD-dependent oxidoreductase
MCHKQPAIETNLRSQITKSEHSTLRTSCTLASLSEDANWVYATYIDPRGKECKIRATFAVGCDGKTGFIRKRYLEPKGITLDQASTFHYEEVWVALNWRLKLPTPQTHPQFPLWKLGYSPEQVYDLFFPRDFRFMCNPQRAAVCGRFGLDEDRLWRLEFVVLQGEDGTEMSKQEHIRKIVYPYITHPGSRYGLKDIARIQYPEDCIEVLRCRPFAFAARSCNKWALGRVILAGDAAHVFPPFGGQGIASGFRDAIGLAWRLVLASRSQSAGENPDYAKLFEGWYSERKQQLDKSLASTVENGGYVTESNGLKILVRDWYLWALQKVPSWRHWLELGNRREGMIRYAWRDGRGMAFVPNMGGGGNFPQVYCRRIAPSTEDRVRFTDDVIFDPATQKGLFQLVVFLKSLNGLSAVHDALVGVDRRSNGCLRRHEATLILDATTTPSSIPSAAKAYSIYRLATGDEFAQDVLCTRRPEPKGYDPHRMQREVGGKKFVILRPDRFVFAACDSADEVLEAAKKIALLVKGQ